MTNTNRGRFQLGIVAALLTLAAGLHGGPPDGAPATPPALRVLITGANRGLGLEFARQFHAAGARVVGTARRPDAADQLKALGVRVEQLDVTDAESVARLASRIGSEPVDIVINNAGIGGRHPSIEQIDADAVDRIFQVNCLGPMRVTQALLPALRKGDRKLVVNISSRLGSIELNGQGGYYGYRESKAALNMFSRSLASELSAEGFTCVVISPGWVRTDMGGSRATLSPAESIQGMIAVINGLTTRDSGGFFDYRGERLPW
jgi:NAD(P)-dependent dehydrogenase (short-subunit alcohol dehydrogenase family)